MDTADILDLAGNMEVTMLEQVIEDGRAWTRETVGPADWTVTLPAAALGEIEAMLQALRVTSCAEAIIPFRP